MNIQFLRINTKTSFENLPNKDTTYKNAIVFIKDTQEIWNDGIYYGAGSKGLIPVTYTELVNLRDNAELIPGMYYRITDYECTTTLDETRSAGHVFDIIVMALSENTVSEMCSAILHDGDEYFANSKLNAWQIWYDLNNDITKYLWADPDGKGVIYRMIDEFNNDCPYDFKNIQFKRYWSDGITVKGNIICEGYYGIGITSTDFIYAYTFDRVGQDAVLFTPNKSDEAHIDVIGFNHIKATEILTYIDDTPSVIKILNNIVFLESPNNIDLYRPNQYAENNFIDTNSTDITFGTHAHNNIIGSYNHNHQFGNYCSYNTFGNSCYSNTFGNYCSYNTFGNYCYSNTFGNYGYIFKLYA